MSLLSIYSVDPLGLWLAASILLPLLAGILFLFMPQSAVRTANFLGLTVATLILVLGLTLWGASEGRSPVGGYHFFSDTPLGLQFMGAQLQLGLNAVSLPLYLLAVIVGFAASLYLFGQSMPRKPFMWGCMLLILAGVLGAFASVDVFYAFLFHEVALLPTLLTLLIFGGVHRRAAALQSGIFMLLGSLVLLVGLLVFRQAAGLVSFSLVEWQSSLPRIVSAPLSVMAVWGLALMLAGAAILSGLWPFYSWVPRLITQAPTPVAMVQAGVLKSFGLYLLFQCLVSGLPQLAPMALPFLAALCVVNILFVGFSALGQTDLLRLVAYAAVMHMGTLFLGLSSATAQGLGGLVLVLVGSGLSSALMVMLSGGLQQRLGSLEMSHIGGVRSTAPQLAMFLMLGLLGLVALPCFVHFWGELGVILGLFVAGQWSVVAVLAGLVIAAGFGLRAISQLLMGSPKPPVLADLSSAERASAWVLAFPLVLFSLIPGQLAGPLHQFLVTFLPQF